MRINAAVDYTPSQIKFSGNFTDKKLPLKKEERNYEHKINVVDWFNTTAFTIGQVTFPGPKNLPAIRSAIKEQFKWVTKLAENGQARDLLALNLFMSSYKQKFSTDLDFALSA